MVATPRRKAKKLSKPGEVLWWWILKKKVLESATSQIALGAKRSEPTLLPWLVGTCLPPDLFNCRR